MQETTVMVVDKPALPQVDKPPRSSQNKTMGMEQSRVIEQYRDSKSKLREALTPPGEAARKIIGDIKQATEAEFGLHPDPAVKRLVDIASGIFLWQQLMLDTRNSLPLGLIFTARPSAPWFVNWFDDISLDTNLLTFQDYDFVMGVFKQHGILDKAARMQREHREANKAVIEESVAGVLRHSQLIDYFDSFSITTEQKKEESRLTPGTVEYQLEKNRLRSEFVRKHGTLPNARSNSRLNLHEVESPMHHRKKPVEESSKREQNIQRKSRFRHYIQSEYITKTGLTDDITARTGVIVQDGNFLFPQYNKAGELTYYRDDQNNGARRREGETRRWDVFIMREIAMCGTYEGLFSFSDQYGEEALKYIIPRLYDADDTRDFDAVIEEGITVTARTIAEDIVKEPLLSLFFVENGRMATNKEEYTLGTRLTRLIWLTDTRRAHLGESHGEQLSLSNLFFSETISLEDAGKKEKKQNSEVLFAAPRVFEGVPRRILTYVSRNNKLPVLPAEADLCIRFTDPSGTIQTEAGENEIHMTTHDPFISGMQLVGRADDRYYFRVSPDEGIYDRVEIPIPRVKCVQMASLCNQIGMRELAGAIKAQPALTIAGFVDLARGYFVEEDFNENRTFVLNHPRELGKTGLVGNDGKLHGQGEVFAYFLAKLISISFANRRTFFGSYQEHGSLFSKNGIENRNSAHAVIALPAGPHHMIDPLGGKGSAPSEKQETEKEYRDRPVRVHVPGQEELVTQKARTIGEIKHVNRAVFDGVTQRLIQTRLRDRSLPLEPESSRIFSKSQRYDLEIEIQDEMLAYAEQDPYIQGMKLIARNGNRCYFQLDSKNNIYTKPQNQLPQNRIFQLIDVCSELGMSGLLDDILVPPVTVKRVTDAVQKHIQGYVPETGRDYDIRNVYYLLQEELIDDRGNLRGGNEVFEYFLRSLLLRVYGEDAVSAESGFALRKNMTQINATVHRQVRLDVPEKQGFPGEAIQCLLSIEPGETTSEAYTPMKVYKSYSEFGGELKPGQLFDKSEGAWSDVLMFHPHGVPDGDFEFNEELSLKIPHYNDTPHNRTKGESVWLQIPTVEDWEKRENIRIGKVKFVHRDVFKNAQQRLIQRQPRDKTVHVIRERKEREMIEAHADLAIQVTDIRLADDQHDLSVLGLRLIARDENKKTFYFRLDREHDLYARVEEQIPPEKREAEAALCDEIGMHQLANDIRNAEKLTVASLIDLDRKYIKPWIPTAGHRNFRVTQRRDFAREGLINEKGELRGVCDSFAFFIADQMSGIFGEECVISESGFRINGDITIDMLRHGQTRLYIPSKNINNILDVEAEPIRLDRSGTSQRTFQYAPFRGGNPFEGVALGNLNIDFDDLLTLLQDAFEHDTQVPEENVQEYASDVSQTAGVQTEMMEKEPVLLDIPSPEEGLAEFKIQGVTPEGQQKAMSGEEARQYLEAQEEKWDKERQMNEEMRCTSLLFQRSLLAYLGQPIDDLLTKVVDERFHKATAAILHKGEGRRYPHILIYAFVREYTQWQEDRTYGIFIPKNKEFIMQAKEMLEVYREHTGEKRPQYQERPLPEYDPRFLHLMERVVNIFYERVGKETALKEEQEVLKKNEELYESVVI